MSGRITQFIELQGNPSTRSSYRSAVRRYLDDIDGPQRKGRIVTREEASEYERLAEKYFSEDRNYTEDLQKFAASLNESRAPYLQAEGAVCVGVADGVAEAIVGEDLNALREENEALRAELSQIRQEIARDRKAVARAEEAIRLGRFNRENWVKTKKSGRSK